MLRTVTFSDPEVARRLDETFVLTWFNQAEDLFPAKPAPGEEQPAVSADYLAAFPDGAGGPNVKFFFCTPDARIVHFAQGYFRPPTFLDEVRYAKELLAVHGAAPDSRSREAALRERHLARSTALQAKLERFATEPSVAGSPAALERTRQRGLLAVLIGNLDLAVERLLQDPGPFMVNEVLGIA